MITVEFMGPIGRSPMQVEANNLEILAALLKQDGELAPWLANCAIAVNDEIVTDRATALKSGDRVLLLPPVCGG